MYKEQTIKEVSLQDKASGAQRSFRRVLAGLKMSERSWRDSIALTGRVSLKLRERQRPLIIRVQYNAALKNSAAWPGIRTVKRSRGVPRESPQKCLYLSWRQVDGSWVNVCSHKEENCEKYSFFFDARANFCGKVSFAIPRKKSRRLMCVRCCYTKLQVVIARKSKYLSLFQVIYPPY